MGELEEDKASKEESYIISAGNGAGLKAIASIAIFFTLLGACIAPYLFSKQELMSVEQKLLHQDETQDENSKRNLEDILKRLNSIEEWRLEHAAIGSATNARQDATDEWMKQIIITLFDKVYCTKEMSYNMVDKENK